MKITSPVIPQVYSKVRMPARQAAFPKKEERRQSGSAFTLIEMLVVIAIIALLASILVPAISNAMQSAKRVACGSSLRQAGLALLQFSHDNKGYLPAMRHGGFNGNDSSIEDGPPTGDQWAEIISGYLGEFTDNINNDPIAAISNACPAWEGRPDLQYGNTKPGYGMNAYPGAGSGIPNRNGNVTQNGPLLDSSRIIPLDALKAPSNTILLGDSVDWHIYLNGGQWVTTSNPDNPYGYYSAHPDRHGKNANYLMADTSVRALRPNEALAYLVNPVDPDLD
jgi:prepilin-type N-terminal cleavage/methylation domain-containing protein/prepilin-type processing-associated H-X9-DG protein